MFIFSRDEIIFPIHIQGITTGAPTEDHFSFIERKITFPPCDPDHGIRYVRSAEDNRREPQSELPSTIAPVRSGIPCIPRETRREESNSISPVRENRKEPIREPEEISGRRDSVVNFVTGADAEERLAPNTRQDRMMTSNLKVNLLTALKWILCNL